MPDTPGKKGGQPVATRSDARLNFRLPSDLKEVIERAAAQRGQSVSNFAIGTLVEASRAIFREHDVTELTRRDREVFTSMLDDTEAKPNQALSRAAKRYKKRP
jgi:uncharacterized protein (DUF1778 family)